MRKILNFLKICYEIERLEHMDRTSEKKAWTFVRNIFGTMKGAPSRQREINNNFIFVDKRLG